MKNFKYILLFVFVAFLFACQKDGDKSGNTDLDRPFVFRSVLDGKPRMLSIGLSPDKFIAYSTVDGSMYKAWKGLINMDGAVFTGAHGPQPTTVGDMYVVNKHDQPWTLMKEGKMQASSYQYRGHKFVDGAAVLMHSLQEQGTQNIFHIDERVSLENTEKGEELKRSFSTENLKDGYSLLLKTNASSIVDKAQWYSDGNLRINGEKDVEFEGRSFMDLSGTLEISQTPVSLSMRLLDATIEDPNLDDGFDRNDSNLPLGAQLIAKNDCKTCHNKSKNTVGPAYIAIAKKYEHNDGNIVSLANKIKSGGSGIWGQQEMTPHPEIPDEDIKEMMKYIFSLADFDGVASSSVNEVEMMSPSTTVNSDDLGPGAVTRIYEIASTQGTVPKNMESKKAIQGGILPNWDNLEGNDFKDLTDNFALLSEGYIEIKEDGIYGMRLWSDDGSVLYLNGKKIIDNDGLHGTEMREAQVGLKKGFHAFRLEFFQGGGGKMLSWNIKPPGAPAWRVVPTEMVSHDRKKQSDLLGLQLPMSIMSLTPGDKSPLAGVHPSFTLTQARPDDFMPKVGGLDFLPDGRAVVSTWDTDGAVYIVDGVSSGDPSKMSTKKIASGLAEPLGVKVIGDDIYVMQKQEMTKLIDTDGDDIIDEFRALSNDWGVSANFHEFGFGLEEQDGYLYANLATGIMPGGAGMVNQHKDRGSVIRVNIADGSLEKVANGLRTPNGIGKGYNGELFIADNQGDWLPASKIVHVQEGSWYGSRAVDFEGTANLKEDKPVVWLPQDEIGNSPSTPGPLNVGPYKNQMIHGEVTHGGIKRVFVEEVNGKLQGCLFRFTQGLEAGVNRISWAPDGALLVGGIGNPGNWQHNGKNWYGLQRLEYNGESTFEILAVRAKSNGVELEFTEALRAGDGWNPEDYEVRQWQYVPTAAYGGPKVGDKQLQVKSAHVSEDRKKVFLELAGMQEDRVVYVRLIEKFVSEESHSLWSSEAWYTMNSIPRGQNGFVGKNRPEKGRSNSLTVAEKAAGWTLLFDGNSLDSWRTYKGGPISNRWSATDGTLHFNPTIEGPGGDIMTKETYQDFELALEWKIQNCGNSGIFYNVVVDDAYDNVWETGPEMQVLDNICHPDTKYVTHRAGDLYDMIECTFSTVKPAGSWNKIMIKSNKGEVEFWMNGYKVVAFTMHNDKWKEMIANSKFKDMPGFGLAKAGHIALQDHGDKVWFRNIKIKKL